MKRSLFSFVLVAVAVLVAALAAGSSLANTPRANAARPAAPADVPVWSPLPGTLAGREGHSAIYDPERQQMVVFGGRRGEALLDGTVVLSLTPGSEAWSLLDVGATKPPARLNHTAIYDSLHQRMIVFGGWDGSDYLYDVWALDLEPGNTRWYQLAPEGDPPSGRVGHSAVWQDSEHRMVIFGGYSSRSIPEGTVFVYHDDVWALSLYGINGRWQELTPASYPYPPEGRRGHVAVYDFRHNRMLVHGGFHGELLRDTWSLSLVPEEERWTELIPAGGAEPPFRTGHAGVYGDYGLDLLVWGGHETATERTNTGMIFDGDTRIWSELVAGGTPPSARNNHTAIHDGANNRVIIYGGSDGEQEMGDAHALGLSTPPTPTPTPTPTRTPTLTPTPTPTPTRTPVGPVDIEVDLHCDDAPGSVEVNKTISTYPEWNRMSRVEVVAELRTDDASARHDVEVILSVPADMLGTPEGVKLRMDDCDSGVNTDFDSPSTGRYRVITDLNPDGAHYTRQVVFTFGIEPGIQPRGMSLSVEVAVPGRTVADPRATAQLNLVDGAEGIIIANRRHICDKFGDDAESLLESIYRHADRRGAPPSVVYFVDTYDARVRDWDNTDVDYTSETTANQVADVVDAYLHIWYEDATGQVMVSGESLADPPNYLLIVGDDDMIPRYRHYDPTGGEEIFRRVANDHPVLNQLVSNNYFFTDDFYAAQSLSGEKMDWQRGETRLATGRIVGASAQDMQRLLRNSSEGPDVSSGNAVVLSRAEDGNIRDVMLPGADNDLVNALRDRRGFNILNDAEIPVTTETDDFDLDDVWDIMAQGFAAFQFLDHGENTHICLSGPDIVADEVDDGEVDCGNCIRRSQPFFHIHACRVGLSLAPSWDQGFVYSLIHHGASGVIASGGLAYSDWGPNSVAHGEQLANDFWLEAIPGSGESQPLGVALRKAKADFDAIYGWSTVERKTVMEYTFFGLPWMRIPGRIGAVQALDVQEQTVDEQPLLPPQAVGLDTYQRTATIDGSNYTISTTVEGFHLVQVEGMVLSKADDGPALPATQIEFFLPATATVTAVTVTPSGETALGTLNIPMFEPCIEYEGAPPCRQVETPDSVGVYPSQMYSLDLSLHDSCQLARVTVMPVVYDAVSDQATLYQSLEVTITYETATPLAITDFAPLSSWVAPGQPISTTFRVANVGAVTETVRAALTFSDLYGQSAGTKLSPPFVVSPGGEIALPFAWTDPLDEGRYSVALTIWQSGESLAQATSSVAVVGGRITELTLPETVALGEDVPIAVTFASFRSAPVSAEVSLTIYDGDLWPIAELGPQTVAVGAGGEGTANFIWSTAGQSSDTYTVEAVVTVADNQYGPETRSVRLGAIEHPIYLPLVRKG